MDIPLDSPLMDIGMCGQEIDEEMEVSSDDSKGKEIQDTDINSMSRCPDNMEESGGVITRKSTRKQKTLLPPSPENKNSRQKPKLTSKPKPKPKLQLKLEQKVKLSAQESAGSQTQTPAYTGMCNYFEEVEINGKMRIVVMHDLMNDFVCLCPTALYFILH
jgi:hypothetical protein